MPITATDKEDIQSMLDSGVTLRLIAQKYDVGETAVRRFIDNKQLRYAKKRTSAQKAHIGNANTAQATHIFTPQQTYQSPLMGENVPLPQSNDPALLQYLLQLKSHEANTHKFNYAELDAKYRKLLDEHTSLEINQKRHQIEMDNAVKDAISNKGGMAEMGLKALEFIGQSEPLSNALAGVINKFSSAVPASTPLLGTGEDANVVNLMKTINAIADQVQRNRVVAGCHQLINDPNILNQLVN